jgi:CRP/FNR family transcriptional regulator
MNTAEALARLPFWGLLTAKEQKVLAARAVIRRDGPGQIVHGGQQDCPGLFLVLSGELRAAVLSEAGREITLYRVGAGEFCVLSASCVISQITFDTQITAESPCERLVIDAATIDGLAENNIALRCALYEQALRRFSEVVWAMQQILFMGMDRRLATFLMGEADRTDALEIAMTHEQIARHISSAREVVARMLKRFAAEGWVRMRRGRITVTDPGALRRLAAADN